MSALHFIRSAVTFQISVSGRAAENLLALIALSLANFLGCVRYYGHV